MWYSDISIIVLDNLNQKEEIMKVMKYLSGSSNNIIKLVLVMFGLLVLSLGLKDLFNVDGLSVKQFMVNFPPYFAMGLAVYHFILKDVRDARKG